MAGRTPQQALESFVRPLQQALSCVCNGVLLASGVRDPSVSHMLRLAASPQRIRAAEYLALTFACYYRVVETPDSSGPWKVSGVGYRCALHDAEHEILAYHWHPLARGDVGFPHLHLSAGARVTHPRLATAHLPTGLVHLEDVLRLAVESFDAQPMRHDWGEVLATSRSASLAAWR